ncbi:ATP-dependent DNA helicase PIF1-like protein, partial [Tanacetum coccineum]
PLKLWETNWQALSEDILHKKRKLYKYLELQLTDEQIRNYCLIEIQELLRRFGRSLTDVKDLPQPNPNLLTNMDNRIASLLLPAGRTAHSRFVIPLDLMENSTCGIKQNTQLAELMQEVQLIIWDKAPMTQRYAFEALDITSELWNYCKVFTLTRTMRVNEYCANGEIDTSKPEFNRWVLAVGDGTLPSKIKEGEDV